MLQYKVKITLLETQGEVVTILIDSELHLLAGQLTDGILDLFYRLNGRK